MGLLQTIELWVKHRGQPAIQSQEGDRVDSSEKRNFFERAYEDFEVVRRGADLITDGYSEIDISIGEVIEGVPTVHREYKLKRNRLNTLINYRPNPEETIDDYRRQLVMDLLLTGNCYQYWDGQFLYHLPSILVDIKTGTKKKIVKYIYDGKTDFFPYEIIHTRDNSGDSVYRGRSRLKSARNSIMTLRKMLDFQDLFFENGAVPGLIFTTPNILGHKIKQKMIADWQRLYSPRSGAKRPIILDADLKVNPISQISFKDLDFENSVSKHELKILKALGVPPILLESGNNANLRPNIQLFYELTVLPLVRKVITSYERFFGYDMEPDVTKVRSLRPELRDAAAYYQGLVNTGIITPNEARAELRLDPSKEPHADQLRVPQNIAGSAADPSEGGRPEGNGEDDEENPEENTEE